MILPFDKPKKKLINEVSLKNILFGDSANLSEEAIVEVPAGNHKLYITKSVDNITPQKAKIAAEFIKFCCKQLGISQPCKVYFTGKRGGPIITTASFNPNNNEIWIYTKGRHICDINRSTAHEIMHFKQNLQGVLNPDSGNDNSPHEQDAHIFSGYMIRLFGKLHPEIFE